MNSLIFGSLLLTTVGFARERSPAAELAQMDAYVRRVDPAKLPHFSRALPGLAAGKPDEDFERVWTC